MSRYLPDDFPTLQTKPELASCLIYVAFAENGFVIKRPPEVIQKGDQPALVSPIHKTATQTP